MQYYVALWGQIRVCAEQIIAVQPNTICEVKMYHDTLFQNIVLFKYQLAMQESEAQKNQSLIMSTVFGEFP